MRLPSRVLIAIGLAGAAPAAAGAGCSGERADGAARDPMKQPAVEAIYATARAQGAGAALDSLAAAIARDSALAPLGHQVAHGVGRYLVAIEGFSPALLASCRPTFQAGCYHGVLEEYVARVPGGLDSAHVRALCQGDTAQPPIVTLECAHGFGHGAFTRAGDRLEPALDTCDALPGDVLVRECQDGVFMQRIVARFGALPSGRSAPSNEHLHAHGTDATAREATANPRAWSCDDEQPRHRPACWAYEPGAILARGPVSADSLSGLCSKLEPALARECWRGMGKLWATWKGVSGGQTVTDACARASAAADTACLRGVVESLVDLDWSGGLASRFCGTVRSEDSEECVGLAWERVALTANP